MVLVCSGCHSPVPQASGLSSRSTFLSVLETGSPGSRCWLMRCLPGAPSWLADVCFLAESALEAGCPRLRCRQVWFILRPFCRARRQPPITCPHVAAYPWLSVSGVSFHKGAHPTLRTSSRPNYLPRAPSPHTITLSLGLRRVNWGARFSP